MSLKSFFQSRELPTYMSGINIGRRERVIAPLAGRDPKMDLKDSGDAVYRHYRLGLRVARPENPLDILRIA